MFSKKYSISLERESLICNETGKLSKFNHVNFLKSKNSFISESLNKEKIILKSPLCEDFSSCYDKFEEIINVLSMELHERGMFIWPILEHRNESESSNFKVVFSVDTSFFKALDKSKTKNGTSKFESNLNNGRWFLCQIMYGLSFRYDKKNNVLFSFLQDISINELVKIAINKNSVELSFKYLNLFDKCGMKKSDLAFLVCFIYGCMLFDSKYYDVHYETLKDSFSHPYYKTIKDELKKLILLDNQYSFGCKDGLKEIFDLLEKKINHNETQIYNDKMSILNLIKEYYEESFCSRYVIKKYPKLDGSAVALIKDALSQGIDFNIIDETKSFVEFTHKNHNEDVIMATMTNRDSYILSYVTDDKQFAKNILIKNKLSVPNGILVDLNMSSFDRECIVEQFVGKPVVVKPKSTNSGTGITILSFPASQKDILNAVKYALRYDDHAIIEDFIKGKEYRFLIVDNECVGVVHRRSASVVGDGKSTIRELIVLKNKEPWHALLDNPVVIDEVAEDFIGRNGYTFDSVPEASKRVFLRENSNCSTGGECIDMTNTMPNFFKEKAIAAAKCFKAKISGVDIIIDDLNSKEYSIIEVNDNPGYSLNEWPYEGKGERIGLYILKMLGF